MKIIDAHTHIGNFGSWARFDFDLARLKEQMAEFDIEKTLLTGAGFHDNKSVIDAFQKEPDLIVPVAWVKPGGAAELAEIRRLVEREGFRAIKLHPLFDAYCADDTFVDPVLDLAEELKIPVFMPTMPSSSVSMIADVPMTMLSPDRSLLSQCSVTHAVLSR